MTPAALARMVHVQSVGENRQGLHQQRDLWVSVEKLRTAFRWLSQNSWPFMEHTKHHESWEHGLLDESFEHILRLYIGSVGSVSGGAPAELIQDASQIDPRHRNVNAAGPADCIIGDDDQVDEDKPDDADNCAGIIDGGVDDTTPIRIWDALMQKYSGIIKNKTEELFGPYKQIHIYISVRWR